MELKLNKRIQTQRTHTAGYNFYKILELIHGYKNQKSSCTAQAMWGLTPSSPREVPGVVELVCISL